MHAYVLIQKEPDGRALASALRAIPGVISAQDVSGPYDALVLARSGSERTLRDEVVREILKVPGVTRALPAPLVRWSDDRLEGPSGARDEAA